MNELKDIKWAIETGKKRLKIEEKEINKGQKYKSNLSHSLIQIEFKNKGKKEKGISLIFLDLAWDENEEKSQDILIRFFPDLLKNSNDKRGIEKLISQYQKTKLIKLLKDYWNGKTNINILMTFNPNKEELMKNKEALKLSLVIAKTNSEENDQKNNKKIVENNEDNKDKSINIFGKPVDKKKKEKEGNNLLENKEDKIGANNLIKKNDENSIRKIGKRNYIGTQFYNEENIRYIDIKQLECVRFIYNRKFYNIKNPFFKGASNEENFSLIKTGQNKNLSIEKIENIESEDDKKYDINNDNSENSDNSESIRLCNESLKSDEKIYLSNNYSDKDKNLKNNEEIKDFLCEDYSEKYEKKRKRENFKKKFPFFYRRKLFTFLHIIPF